MAWGRVPTDALLEPLWLHVTVEVTVIIRCGCSGRGEGEGDNDAILANYDRK